MAGRERKQGDVAGPLDRFGYLALVLGAVAGNPARNDLAAFGNKVAQAPGVFIVNLGLVDAKTATLATGKATTWLKSHI